MACVGLGSDSSVSVRKGLREGVYRFVVSPFKSRDHEICLLGEENKRKN